MHRIGGLDGLRGILAVLVAYAHTYGHLTGWSSGLNFVNNAGFAVDVFFILSSFVLVASFKIRFGVVSLRKIYLFFVMRFFRLYPLFFVSNILIILIFYIFQGGVPTWISNDFPRDFFYNLLMANSIGINDVKSINHPSWSISIEFYVGTITVLTACYSHRLIYLITGIAIWLLISLNLRVSGADDAVMTYLTVGMIRCIFCMGAAIIAVDFLSKVELDPLFVTSH